MATARGQLTYVASARDWKTCCLLTKYTGLHGLMLLDNSSLLHELRTHAYGYMKCIISNILHALLIWSPISKHTVNQSVE